MRKGFIVVFALAAAGCSEQVHDVAYYKANRAELKAKLAECRNDPGRLAETPNCQNAGQAQRDIIFSPDNKGMPRISGKRY